MRVRPVVLIVDDTLDQLDLYEMALSDQYTTVRATTGEGAITGALTERPDVIVLDVMMPGDDGFATCARLKEHPVTRRIPVLLLHRLRRTGRRGTRHPCRRDASAAQTMRRRAARADD